MTKRRHGRRNLIVAVVGLMAIIAAAGTMSGGFIPTTPNSTAAHTLTSGAALDLGKVFGNARCVQVIGTKFEDLDGNGVRDPGEPPLAGITIRLTGTDGQGNEVDLTTVTDENGVFHFPCLAPDTYAANEVLDGDDMMDKPGSEFGLKEWGGFTPPANP